MEKLFLLLLLLLVRGTHQSVSSVVQLHGAHSSAQVKWNDVIGELKRELSIPMNVFSIKIVSYQIKTKFFVPRRNSSVLN